MNDPYAVLAIGPYADEAEIRSRYLELVRRFPPETEPEKAAEIRAAYDAIRDPVKRMESRLFDLQSTFTFEASILSRRPDVRAQRIPTDVLLTLGRP